MSNAAHESSMPVLMICDEALPERLYKRGMSAETLMVLMRHRDFTTKRKFYGAKQRAESALAKSMRCWQQELQKTN